MHHPEDFRLRTELIETDFRPHRQLPTLPSTGPRQMSQSEHDWAYAKRALGRGDDPEEIIRRIADFRGSDKSDPVYYARLTVTKALADLDMPPMQSNTSVKANNEGGERETQR
jgi:hypothetical protein